MKGCDVIEGPIQKLITAEELLFKKSDAKFANTISLKTQFICPIHFDIIA